MRNPDAMLPDSTRASDASHEDRRLLARIVAHDRAAFTALYLAYHKRMSRFLLRFLRRPDQVEEVINDTLYAVWCKAADFRGDSQVSTWIFGIAYRKALKALKRASGGPQLDDSVDLESIVNVDVDMDQGELRQRIDRALGALPDLQRLTIELAYFMGHSCEEIAAITECPVNTVKTRLFHARARLRELLPDLHNWPLP